MPGNFDGYNKDDIVRVRSLLPHDLLPQPDVFTDVFGVKVSPAYCPWISANVGKVQTEEPFPGDGYLAEGIEFVAFSIALSYADVRKGLTVVELGAGWGPWTSLAGLCGKRLGFAKTQLVAIEADPKRYQYLKEHLALNNVAAETHCAAAWWKDDTLHWPDVADGQDAGLAAVSGTPRATDYKGEERTFIKIPALAIQRVLNRFPIIDLMHIDIQGGEWELIKNCIGFLNERVRCIFIGTHSRKIEGDLIDFCNSHKWTLERETPCQFYSALKTPELTGATYKDGGQFWSNDRLRG